MDLNSLAISFQFNEESYRVKEASRKDFIEKFPKDKIKELTLEEYVIGPEKTGPQSFCSLLEKANKIFSIKGQQGGSYQYGIYYSKKTKKYIVGHQKKHDIVEQVAAKERFMNVKNDIVKALEYIEKNEIDKVLNKMNLFQPVLLKILCTYYPEKFLAIKDIEILKKIAGELKLTLSDNLIYLNYKCRENINLNQIFNSWESGKINVFFEEKFNDEINSTKDALYEKLKKFISQSGTQNLGIREYAGNFEQLEIKVSFGRGNVANIPWFALTSKDQTIKDGFYPVYLYYIKNEIIILAAGVGEEGMGIQNNRWDTNGMNTIRQHFKNKNLGEPRRYGSSYVYKVYRKDDFKNEQTIIEDLENLIIKYKSCLINQEERKEGDSMICKKFNADLNKAGMLIASSMSTRFIASLITKPFVILTGLSGSGKTKLAQLFAKWICENESQYCLVPVGADWYNRDHLLGFKNALMPNTYNPDNYGILKLLIEANKNREKPYFIILDEMNLSHVERYFSDFLSTIETKEKISLYEVGNGEDNCKDIPKEIDFPNNLFIIGTVNIDETTYMFSPKVLDRANVIEFRVTKESMKEYLEKDQKYDFQIIKSKGVVFAKKFVLLSNSLEMNPPEIELNRISEELIELFEKLENVGAEFGFRTASEIVRFVSIVQQLDNKMELIKIIDVAVMQKLLPKVHGSRKKLEPFLKVLGNMCFKEGDGFDEYFRNRNINNNIKYPVSLDKICRMYENLISNGFTSYAEA